MPLLNKIGIRWAAYFATRQQVPNHYSPRNRGNNFTYFWVCHEDTELEKFLPTLNGVRSGLNGIILPSESSRWPPGNMTEACLPYSRLGKPKIKIFRHYNETEIEFSSVWMYILSELTRFHKLKNQLESKREHREQRKFSRNFQFSSERMGILGKIVEWRRSKSKNEGRNALASDFSHIDFCDHVFSRRFFGLDDYNYYLDEVEFVLDSLVSSNDLTKHGARYRLTGNSISSLSSFEKEKEQASRAAKHDSAILRLTAILAFAALVSLCIQYNALNP